MAKRQRDMNTIEEAMQLHQQGQTKQFGNAGLVSVLPSPGGAPADLSPGARPDYDTLAPPPPPETPEARRVRQAQEEILGKEEADRLREQQAREEARKKSLLGLADSVTSKTRETLDSGSARIAGIPTPGSLWFPLVLLLLFFFILILYNGHTRLQWLWLVLTGNAQVYGGGGTTGSGGSTPGIDTTPAQHASTSPSGVHSVGGSPY